MFPLARLTLGLILAASTYRNVAGQGHVCCSPDAWEGSLGHRGSGFGLGLDLGNDEVHYDYSNCRVAIHHRGESSTRGAYDVIVINDYKKGKSWLIYVKEQRCNVYNTTEDMRRDCVTEDQVFHGTFHLGSENHMLECNSYTLDTPMLHVWFARTRDDCVVVNAAQYEKLTHSEGPNATAGLQTFTLYNVTPGIKDPAVFTPAPFCSQAQYVGGEPEALKKFGSYQMLKKLFIQ